MMPCHFYAMLQQSMPLKISVRYWYLIFTLYVGLFLPNWMLTDVDLSLLGFFLSLSNFPHTSGMGFNVWVFFDSYILIMHLFLPLISCVTLGRCLTQPSSSQKQSQKQYLPHRIVVRSERLNKFMYNSCIPSSMLYGKVVFAIF